MSVKIVLLPVPNKGDDIVEWIENHGDAATPDSMRAEIEAMVAAAGDSPATSEAKQSEIVIRSAGSIVTEFTEMRLAIIDGLLRLGEIMNLIATSKAKKSWLMLSLGLSACMGWKWFGHFWVRQSTVLIVDNELHLETISDRVKRVAEAMLVPTVDYADRLHFVSLRGQLVDLNKLASFLKSLKPGQFDLIILDAFYRFLPAGVDENSNADITALYNLIDSVLAYLGAAVIIVHHASKGNQSSKSITDTGSGAGAQSRAADTHMTMIPHEEPDAAVIAAVTRSWPQMEPRCVRWKYPLWELDNDLDPTELKQEKPRKKPAEQTGPSKEEAEKSRHDLRREKLSQALVLFPNGETESKIATKAGLSNQVAGPIFMDLLAAKIIEPCAVTKNKVEYPAVRLVLTRSDRSDRSDKTICNPICPTAEGGVDRTGALSLESTVRPTSTTPSGMESKSQRDLSDLSRNDERNGLFA